MIRSARLVAVAVVFALALLYVGWSRPLDFDTLAADESRLAALDEQAQALPQTPPPPPQEGVAADTDDATSQPELTTTTSAAGLPDANDGDSKVPPEPVVPPPPAVDCPNFEQYMRGRPGPPSAGHRKFPLVRPPPACRTFSVPAVEEYLVQMQDTIKDPDLYRLFENSFPNTLDTMIKWHGYALDADGNQTSEELSYVITGDIDAMWLRDSASQLYSYRSFLSPHAPETNDNINSLNSLWRGLINSHARYILISPYCHSFQPPPESGIPPSHNGAYKNNNPIPSYNPAKVFDCKWELDSLASFLQASVAYWEHTHDIAFFARYNWIDAVASAVEAAGAMRVGTYDEEGHVLPSAWKFTGWTNRGSETLTNDGLGNPVRSNGLVRSAFRPSDDACIYQLFVPANMMWAKYLEEASVMMQELGEGAAPPGILSPEQEAQAKTLTAEMRDFAAGIRRGIDKDAIVTHREFGEIFAYEVDGFGGVNLMDDANVPSLLSMPLFKYAESRFPLPWLADEDADPTQKTKGAGAASKGRTKQDYFRIYQNTRRFIMSSWNPYWAWGPALSAVGGPHLGPGKGWPMAALVAGLSAFAEDTGYLDNRGKEAPLADDGQQGEIKGLAALEQEVALQLGMVLNSTSGWGVVHESVASWSGTAFTRAWFGWANGLLGELILRIEQWERQTNKGGITGLLGRSWQ